MILPSERRHDAGSLLPRLHIGSGHLAVRPRLVVRAKGGGGSERPSEKESYRGSCGSVQKNWSLSITPFSASARPRLPAEFPWKLSGSGYDRVSEAIIAFWGSNNPSPPLLVWCCNPDISLFLRSGAAANGNGRKLVNSSPPESI